MLHPEITFDDVLFLVLLTFVYVFGYLCYRAGEFDGYQKGCRARRLAERQVRRTTGKRIKRLKR